MYAHMVPLLQRKCLVTGIASLSFFTIQFLQRSKFLLAACNTLHNYIYGIVWIAHGHMPKRYSDNLLISQKHDSLLHRCSQYSTQL